MALTCFLKWVKNVGPNFISNCNITSLLSLLTTQSCMWDCSDKTETKLNGDPGSHWRSELIKMFQILKVIYVQLFPRPQCSVAILHKICQAWRKRLSQSILVLEKQCPNTDLPPFRLFIIQLSCSNEHRVGSRHMWFDFPRFVLTQVTLTSEVSPGSLGRFLKTAGAAKPSPSFFRQTIQKQQSM